MPTISVSVNSLNTSIFGNFSTHDGIGIMPSYNMKNPSLNWAMENEEKLDVGIFKLSGNHTYNSGNITATVVLNTLQGYFQSGLGKHYINLKEDAFLNLVGLANGDYVLSLELDFLEDDTTTLKFNIVLDNDPIIGEKLADLTIVSYEITSLAFVGTISIEENTRNKLNVYDKNYVDNATVSKKVNITDNNADDYLQNGFYFGTNVTNFPTDDFYNMTVSGNESSSVTQIVTERITNKTYLRTRKDTIWNDWVVSLDSKNVSVIDGRTTFNVQPISPLNPIAPNELTNKNYVDNATVSKKVNITDNNADDYLQNGFYFGTNVTNFPTDDFYNMTVSGNESSSVTQIATERITNKTYLRTRKDTTWNDWIILSNSVINEKLFIPYLGDATGMNGTVYSQEMEFIKSENNSVLAYSFHPNFNVGDSATNFLISCDIQKSELGGVYEDVFDELTFFGKESNSSYIKTNPVVGRETLSPKGSVKFRIKTIGTGTDISKASIRKGTYMRVVEIRNV